MAEAANPMEYYILPLSKEEHKKGGVAHGYKYVKEHEDRWVLFNGSNYELQTYDRGYTQVVYENKVYMIIKDYIIIDENKRVFVLGTVDAEVDRIETGDTESEDAGETDGTEGKNETTDEVAVEESIDETVTEESTKETTSE